LNALLSSDEFSQDVYSQDVWAKLIGVIDLKGQRAVHAVAGNRDRYQPVSFCDGDPVALAKHYREIGVVELYVADLDAIEGREIQTSVIEQLGDLTEQHPMAIDIGWTGKANQTVTDRIGSVSDMYPHFRWVAATESMVSSCSLEQLVELVSADRTLLGLDFFQGNLLGSGRAGDLGMGDWIDTARRLAVAGSVILDLAGVGLTSGPMTTEICRSVKAIAPEWTLLSGGGIRSAQDVCSLLDAGCDRCLVATALHGIL